jgi:hypothetical protein
VLLLLNCLFVLLGALPRPRHGAPAGLVAMATLRMCADADALAHPDRARPEHAPQFAGLGQVKPLMRPQREVLVIPGQHAGTVAGAVCTRTAHPLTATIFGSGRSARVRARKPVVRIRPVGRLLRILPGGAHLGGEVRKLVAAALANGSERDRVPRQLQRYLIWLANPITARHSLDGQHGTIYAAQRPHNGTLTSARPAPATPTHPKPGRRVLSANRLESSRHHDHVKDVSPVIRLFS